MIQSILFTPSKIGQVEIPNRFVRSATHDFMSNKDGSISKRENDLYHNLAQGEIGLIISGHAYVNKRGIASLSQIAVDDDRYIEGLLRVTSDIHTTNSCIFLQISHAGRQTKPKLCGSTPLSPSEVYDPTFQVTPKEMSTEEIHHVIEDFVQAAKRAQEAEFDGIQLHVAHGYLLSSFISPYTNRRTDEWGGNTAARLHIIIEILRKIKKATGADFPVIVKLNSSDFLAHGLILEEAIQIAQLLEKEGIDGIEVSGGMAESGKASIWEGLLSEEEEGYFVDSAAQIKKATSIPILGLGGIRTFSVMEKMVEEGKVDFISMSRPFIRDPFLVKKFRTGEIDQSECISCNSCMNPRGISCPHVKES